jgi:predicted permease
VGNESKDDVVASMHAQATSVILLYTLFMTLLRWTYGFQLLSPPPLKQQQQQQHHQQFISSRKNSEILYSEEAESSTNLLVEESQHISGTKTDDSQLDRNSRVKARIKFYKDAIAKSFDTPVIACIVGICIGIVPIFKTVFYGPVFQPLVGALSWLGAGYVPSVMLILGQELWAGSQEQNNSEITIILSNDAQPDGPQVKHTKAPTTTLSTLELDVEESDMVMILPDSTLPSGESDTVIVGNITGHSHGGGTSLRTTRWAIAVSLVTRLLIVPFVFYCFVSLIWTDVHIEGNKPVNNENDDDNNMDSEANHEVYRARAALALSLLVESAGPAAIILVVMCSLHHFQQKEMAQVMLFAYPIGFVTLLMWTTLFMSMLAPS